MQISQIMTPMVHTIQAETTLEQAARHMRDEDVGFLPVVDKARLAGTLTDRDIVVRALASGKDPRTTSVSEIMTGDPACCHEDDDTSKAVAVMEERKVRRMLVLDPKEQVVGIVSLGDISAVDPRQTGEALQTITEQAPSGAEGRAAQAPQDDEEAVEKVESIFEERINPLS